MRKCLKRLGILFGDVVGRAEIVERVGISRFQFDGIGERADRFRITSGFIETGAEIVISHCVIRFKLDRLLQRIDRLRQHPQFVVGETEVTERGGVVRLDSHGLLISFRSFGVTIKTQVTVTQRVVGLAPIRFDSDRFLESVYRLFMILGRAVGNAQVEKCVRIVWLERQRFLESFGGFSVLAAC